MTIVAVGGIWHETNTFAAGTTTAADFRAYQFAAGADLVERYTGVSNEIGGFLEGARAAGLEVQPLLFAAAVPSPVVERSAYEELASGLCDRVGRPPDGVLLALHGALVVDGIDDPELDLVRRVRDVSGASVPVVATLDFHANVSEELFSATDALVGYDTYPHVDPFERGVEAAALLASMVARGAVPAKAFRKLPLLTAPAAQETGAHPMRAVRDLVDRLEAESGAVVTVSPGFPYADVPRAGMAIAAYAHDAGVAEDLVEQVASFVWSRRDDFTTPGIEPNDAVRLACDAPVGPVILVDVADNIGGGAPGDGTVLLDALLSADAASAVVTIADPHAVAVAEQAGTGASVELVVGGKTDDMHGSPVALSGRVRSVHDGRYVHTGSYMTGQVTDMGRTVVVDAGASGGVAVVISERKAMPFDAEQLRSVGIEPADQRIIVVKSAIAWRAAYGDVAADAIAVRTPGVCTSDLPSLPYMRVPRPIIPLDQLTSVPTSAGDKHKETSNAGQ